MILYLNFDSRDLRVMTDSRTHAKHKMKSQKSKIKSRYLIINMKMTTNPFYFISLKLLLHVDDCIRRMIAIENLN